VSSDLPGFFGILAILQLVTDFVQLHFEVEQIGRLGLAAAYGFPNRRRRALPHGCARPILMTGGRQLAWPVVVDAAVRTKCRFDVAIGAVDVEGFGIEAAAAPSQGLAILGDGRDR
jgi:hypothetical protein